MKSDDFFQQQDKQILQYKAHTPNTSQRDSRKKLIQCFQEAGTPNIKHCNPKWQENRINFEVQTYIAETNSESKSPVRLGNGCQWTQGGFEFHGG